MKQHTIGVFTSRDHAERAIARLHADLGIGNDEISYIYRNTDGDVKEVSADDVANPTVGEGAKQGATVGGAIGAVAGLAAVAGVIPVVGPIFAAGPLVTALGLTGALGTTAAGAVTGAAAGGLIGALISVGVSEQKAKEYEDRVVAGSVLVAVHADETKDVASVLTAEGATDVDIYTLTV